VRLESLDASHPTHAERQHTFFLASLANDTIKIVCPGTYEEATRVVAGDGER